MSNLPYLSCSLIINPFIEKTAHSRKQLASHHLLAFGLMNAGNKQAKEDKIQIFFGGPFTISRTAVALLWTRSTPLSYPRPTIIHTDLAELYEYKFTGRFVV